MYQNVQCENASTVSFCILVMADSACGTGMGNHAKLLLTQRGGVVGFWGDIFYMAGQSCCRLTGHRMWQSTTQNLGPSFAAILDALGLQRAPHFILLDNNCTPHTARLVTARLVPAPSPGLLRSRLIWVSRSCGVQSKLWHARLNKCDQNASLAYQGPWL